MRRLVALVLLAACGDDGDPPAGADAGADGPALLPDGGSAELRDRLEAIPGLTVSEEPLGVEGVRFFRLTYQQPADHDEPARGTFTQQMTLLHRGEDLPMVFALNGYYLQSDPYEEEPTALLGANQLTVEHRFFYPSQPDPVDWSLLTIAQSAADHHRIAEAFRPLYPAAWISTGASKGGMTSIYHRRFYPDDVDATVAYVAPIMFGAPDPRFDAFFDTVGDAACRQAIRDLQRELLIRREVMVPRMQAFVDEGYTFEILGGLDAAFESSVTSLLWLFWQYQDASRCADVPPVSGTDDELWGFLDAVATPPFSSSDAIIQFFGPFYVQLYAELGYPTSQLGHLADLLVHEEEMPDILPPGATVTFDASAMVDIDQWVQSEGRTLLFIYGEYDPWTQGRHALGQAVDSFVLTAPGANHGASIGSLAPSDAATALDALERWTGVTPSTFRARSLRPRECLPPLPLR